MILIVGLIAIGVFLYFSPTVINSIWADEGLASEPRWLIWKATLENASKYLFVGTGIGTSTLINGVIGPAHNFFLEILCEFGFVGLFAIITFLSRLLPRKMEIKREPILKYFNIFFWIFLISSICPSTMQGYYFLWAIFGVSMTVRRLSIDKMKISGEQKTTVYGVGRKELRS